MKTVIVGLLSLVLQRSFQTRAFFFRPNQTRSGDYTATCTQIKELKSDLTSAVYRLTDCSRTRAAGSSCLTSSRVNKDPNYLGAKRWEAAMFLHFGYPVCILTPVSDNVSER